VKNPVAVPKRWKVPPGEGLGDVEAAGDEVTVDVGL
jgi:hypothetical protein